MGEGPTYGLMEVLDNQRKSFTLILLKETQNVAWFYPIMLIIVICLLMENKESQWKRKFKADNKNANFRADFYFRNISDGFSASKSREVSLNKNA